MRRSSLERCHPPLLGVVDEGDGDGEVDEDNGDKGSSAIEYRDSGRILTGLENRSYCNAG